MPKKSMIGKMAKTSDSTGVGRYGLLRFVLRGGEDGEAVASLSSSRARLVLDRRFAAGGVSIVEVSESV